jgi:hypothetical protein
MNAIQALEEMRKGTILKTKKGIQNNLPSTFHTNSISIIFETYKDKGKTKESMYSIRNFLKLANNIEFYI